MAKAVVKVLVGSLLFMSFCCKSLAAELVWENIGGINNDFKCITVSPYDQKIIFAGSGNRVLKTIDAGESWNTVFTVKGLDQFVNSLLFDPEYRNGLYAATGDGLYYTVDQGMHWKRIFRVKGLLENECRVVIVSAFGIYLGTKAGLFFSKDKGQHWYKTSGILGSSYIFSIAYNNKEPDSMYVASASGLYKTIDKGRSWHRVFLAFSNSSEVDEEEQEEDSKEQERDFLIRDIKIDEANPGNLYLATSRGIYLSENSGNDWQVLSNSGLLDRDVRLLLLSCEDKFFAATRTSVNLFTKQRWVELTLRLIVEEINSLVIDRKNNLYVATDKGLFKAEQKFLLTGNNEKAIGVILENEPKIAEIQAAAIKYAEVEIEKIKEWRSQAVKKAWLPQVNLGLNRNVTDLWHWEGGSTTKSGDDMLMRGKDSLEWDVSFNWDLGELIWNNDQTSIDVRSRLLVQLRDDILDEVTKLYFERLRVKMELDNLAVEDRKKRFEKELRLQELTASLDGMTDGYFSKCLKLVKMPVIEY